MTTYEMAEWLADALRDLLSLAEAGVERDEWERGQGLLLEQLERRGLLPSEILVARDALARFDSMDFGGRAG